MGVANTPIKVLFIAGGLSAGGAEKQFLYMIKALKRLNSNLLVVSLTRGEYYEQHLLDLHIPILFVEKSSPVHRLARIIQIARSFQPHFIQSTHYYTGFYSGITSRFCQATSIGAIRSDFYHDLEGVGRLGPFILRLPDVWLANSRNARENAVKSGLNARRVFVLRNVIDLESDHTSTLMNQDLSLPPKGDAIRAVTVARLVPVKRLERFIQAISIARQVVPDLQGVIVGSGPEEEKLRRLSETLGLTANSSHPGILFLGQRSDIPQILSRMDISVMTSDQEGFPNIILEAMAATLPIISTPAGEAKELIQDGINGYLIPFNDIDRLSQQLIRLAKSPELRLKLGEAGRKSVEQEFSFPRLHENLLKTYQDIARYDNNKNAILSLNQIQEAV